MKIYKKLLEIQKEVLGLQKDKKSFSYSYLTGDKLLGYIKPLMNGQGLLLKQEVVKVEKERVDYKTSKGVAKSEILYSVWQKFTWIDTETGETDVNDFFSSGMNDWEKGLGSALTYAERYFLLKYFHIPTDKDDVDSKDRKPAEPKKSYKKPYKKTPAPIKPKLPPTFSKKGMLDFIKNKDEAYQKKVSNHYLVFSIDELTVEQLKEYYEKLKK